jgi:hypothetical protein
MEHTAEHVHTTDGVSATYRYLVPQARKYLEDDLSIKVQNHCCSLCTVTFVRSLNKQVNVWV